MSNTTFFLARIIFTVLSLLSASAGLAGCGEPSTERIALASRTSSLSTPEEPLPKVLVVGDVLVVDARPQDDDGNAVNACSRATSSDPGVVEVGAVRDTCRLFIVAARLVGRARISFGADDVENTIELEVIRNP